MRTSLRTYHPVPSLQKTDGNLQDAPRIKNLLKACQLPHETDNVPGSPSELRVLAVSSRRARWLSTAHPAHPTGQRHRAHLQHRQRPLLPLEQLHRASLLPFTRIPSQQYPLSREHRSTFPDDVDFSHLIDSKSSTYCAVKQSVVLYQHTKRALLGPSAPFAGWICSGRQWEGFDCQGALSAVPVSVAEDLTVVAENEAQVVS